VKEMSWVDGVEIGVGVFCKLRIQDEIPECIVGT